MNNFHGFNQICSKHPHHMSVGVCGSCVRERLASLIDSIDSLPPPPPPDPPLVPNLPLAEEHEHEHEHEHEEEEEDDDDDDEKEVDPPPPPPPPPHSGHGFHDMLASLPHLKLTPLAKKDPLNHHLTHNSAHHNVSNATLTSRDVAEKSQRKKTTGTGAGAPSSSSSSSSMMMMMMMMMRAPSSRGSFASESELNIETSSSANHNTPHVGNHLTATPSHAHHANAHALVNHANKKSSNSWFSSFSHVPTKPKPLKKPIVHSDRDSEQLVKVMKSPPPHHSWILYSTSNTKAQQQQPEQAKSGSKRVNHHHKADLEAISETNNLNISVANPITHHHNSNNNSNINRSNSSSWLLSLFNRRKSSRSSSKRHTNGGGGGDVNVNINININKVRGEEIDRSDGSRVTPDHHHHHHHHESPSFLANMENVVIEGMMSPAPHNKWDELVQAKQGVGYIPNVTYNKVPNKMSDEHVNGMMEARGSNMRLGGDASPARSEDICMSRNVTNDGHELLQGMPPHGLQRCKSVHVTRGSNSITFDLKQVASSPMNNNIVMQQPRDPKQPNVQQPHHLLHPHFNIPNDYEEYNASADAEIRNFPRSRSWGRRAWSRTLSPLWGLKNNNNRKLDVSVDNETPTTTRNHRRHHHHHRGFHDHPHPHPGSLTPTHIFNSKSSSGATITTNSTSTTTTTTTTSSSITSIPSSTTSYLSPLRRNNPSHDTRIHSAQ